jgi:hypothetical protein
MMKEELNLKIWVKMKNINIKVLEVTMMKRVLITLPDLLNEIQSIDEHAFSNLKES